jgi:hypothetical protein
MRWIDTEEGGEWKNGSRRGEEGSREKGENVTEGKMEEEITIERGKEGDNNKEGEKVSLWRLGSEKSN